MTTTQPPACGKISEIRARDLCGMGTPSSQSAHDRRTLLCYIDELLSHRHPAPVADERAEVGENAEEALRKAKAEGRREFRWRGSWLVHSLIHKGPAV